MKKALMMASVASMIDGFNRDNIRILQDLGAEVDIACNFELETSESTKEREKKFQHEMEQRGFKTYQLPVPRKISAIKSMFTAYYKMRRICKENHYNLVHCHSPIGGVIARVACKGVRKNGTKVVYTAHGFHFYKGAPKINWILYYTVEKFVSKYTDLLITINHEDYERAKSFKAKKVVYLPGIGVDTGKFKNVNINRESKREQLGIPENTVVLLSIAEMIKRKNQETALRAVSQLENSNYIYLICGEGPLENYLKELTKELKIDDRVRFLGYRKDIPEICRASDLFVLPSYQEGLSVSVMEAMSAGLPVICSSIRGNTDLIEEGKGGLLHKPEDVDQISKELEQLINDKELRTKMGEYNQKKIEKYDKKIVNSKMRELYRELLEDH
jgi:glycosyltransferase involved in cell wall biosynthesis